MAGFRVTSRGITEGQASAKLSQLPSTAITTVSETGKSLPLQAVPGVVTARNVADFGARGDARAVTVSITGGQSAVTGTGFVSADNGKTLAIAGAGVAAATLIGTVTYVNSTSLTLSVAASTTVSGGPAVLGTDDTAAIQAAIQATFSAQRVFFPKPPGPLGFAYLVTSSLTITHPSIILQGAARDGAQVWYAGSTSLFENGTNDGQLFDANDYSGNEAVRIENMKLVAAPAGTALANAQGNYAPGTIGFRDWRGGDIQFDNAWWEGFDQPFWGIASDLNNWHDTTFIRNHSGAYIGPRSDQTRCTGRCYFIFNDRALDIDGSWGHDFSGTVFVDNGATGTNPIRIRSQWARGAHGFSFDNCWFEHLLGVNPLEAFIEFAIGDSVASPVSDGLTVTNPVIVTNSSGGGVHMQYLVKTGNCDNVAVETPQGLGGYGLIDAVFFHVDTVKAPRLYLSVIQQSGGTTQPSRVVLGAGAAVAQLTRLDWGGGALGIADGQTSGTTVGRAQIQFVPNLNFPQIRFVSGNGTITWQFQVSITDAAPKLRIMPPSGGGELHIQDKSAVDHILFTDAQDGVFVGASGHKLGFYGTTPIVKPTAGAATAAAAYGTNEQTMLQTVYNAARSLGLMT